MRIKTLTVNERGAWQDYVSRHPRSTAYHDLGWFDILNTCFDVGVHYLFAVNENGLWRGILPLYFTKSILAESALMSLESGLLGDDLATRNALVAEALKLRDTLRVKYLLLRGGDAVDLSADRSDDVLYPIVKIEKNLDLQWKKVKNKTRWYVRQAQKNGFSVKRVAHMPKDFYTIYAESMRHHGTPVMSRRFLDMMVVSFAQETVCHAIYRGKDLIGGAVSISGNTGWINQIASVSRRDQGQFPNYLLYWKLIEDALMSAVPGADLGRTRPHTSLHLFKRKWGTDDINVQYRYYFREGCAHETALDRFRDQKTLKQRLWSKLPLAICNCLGPVLRKQLPFG